MIPETVTIKTLPEYVSFLISEFYKNNPKPFLESLCDDALWIGPDDGQRIEGISNIRQAFGGDGPRPDFTLGTVYTELKPHGTEQCDSVTYLERSAITADGRDVSEKLVFHLSWVKLDYWRLSVVSICYRRAPEHPDDLYRSNESDNAPRHKLDTRLRFRVKSSDNVVFISRDRIEWAETSGHYSVIHFDGANVTVCSELTALERIAKGNLFRIGQSFLVNPRYVSSLEKYTLFLRDGTALPIPERMYATVYEKLAPMIPNGDTEKDIPEGDGAAQ